MSKLQKKKVQGVSRERLKDINKKREKNSDDLKPSLETETDDSKQDCV